MWASESAAVEGRPRLLECVFTFPLHVFLNRHSSLSQTMPLRYFTVITKMTLGSRLR